MPGIVGLITRLPRKLAEPRLVQMLESIKHESFYEVGTFVDERAGVYIGWTAHENSSGDGMPLYNGRRDVCLIFSGEDYSGQGAEGGREKQAGGAGAQTSSYLVRLYEENPDFPASLNGLFHGLVVDNRGGAAVLFNDRFGMHRVYYHEGDDAFYFAAEAKAILAVRPDLRVVDPQGLGEFVACSCVLEDRTIFKGIYTLPGGSAWVFRNGEVQRKGAYFEPREWEEEPSLAPDEYYERLRDTLAMSLRRYFEGDRQVGIALTGGLDTRVILALRKPAPGSLPCYTFGGMYRDSKDVLLARKVAGVCEQSHDVVTVGQEFLSRFPHYAERSVYLTEGGVDVYRASDLYVSELARKIAPVKVVGTYGSEIIRRAVMFKPMPIQPELYGPDLLASVDRAKNTYSKLRQQHPVTFAAFRQSPWYHSGILSLESSQLTVRSPYLDNDFVRTTFQAPTSDNGFGDVRLRLIADGSPILAGMPTDRGVRVGAGRFTSLVARGLPEFTFKAEYAYDYGMPQWVARIDHLLQPLHIERLFLGRHKLLHFRVWYRDALSDYVREMLLDQRTLSRPYLERKGVEAIVHGHLEEGRNFTTAIHKLLTLELIHRLFIDS